MTRKLSLQDFGSTAHGLADLDGASAQSSVPMSEPDALEAYDSGYKNGWADCAAAEANERSSVAVDLAKNLAEARLTYDAARRDVLAALGPFFEEVSATLLPQMAAAAVAPNVLAELGSLADAQADARIVIVAAPNACASLERLIDETELDATVRAEPAYAEGQVSIRAGADRRDLDMAGAAARITEAIAGFRAQIAEAETPEPTLSQGAA